MLVATASSVHAGNQQSTPSTTRYNWKILEVSLVNTWHLSSLGEFRRWYEAFVEAWGNEDRHQNSLASRFAAWAVLGDGDLVQRELSRFSPSRLHAKIASLCAQEVPYHEGQAKLDFLMQQNDGYQEAIASLTSRS